MKRPENGASVAWIFSRYSSMSGGGSISRRCASAYADILTSFLRLAAYLALTAHELPEPVGEDPCQHRPEAGAHRSTSRILKSGQLPLAVLPNRDQRLNGVTRRRGRGPAPHDGAAERVHERHVRGQELNPRHVSNEARAFEPLVEQRSVKRHHVLTTLEMCAVECDEVAVLANTAANASPLPAFHPSMHCWYK